MILRKKGPVECFLLFGEIFTNKSGKCQFLGDGGRYQNAVCGNERFTKIGRQLGLTIYK